MLRLITLATLTALVPSSLVAQEQGVDASYTFVPTWNHAVASTQMACNSCHVADSALYGVTFQPHGQGAAQNLVYSTVFQEYMPGAATAASRLGKVTFVPLTNNLVRSHLPIDKEPAFIVSEVHSDSETVKPGDVILTVNAIPVDDRAKVLESVEADRDKPVRILLIRAGKRTEEEVSGTLFARPEQPYVIGVQVEQPGDALRSQLNLYENEGLLITEIVEDSPAQKAGFQKHDILLRAGEQRISTLEDLRACVNASKGEAIELTFMRSGKEQKLSATPERQQAPEATDEYIICPRMSTGINYFDLMDPRLNRAQRYLLEVESSDEPKEESDESDD